MSANPAAAVSSLVKRPRLMSVVPFKRLLGGLLILFLVSVVIFAATQALPGDSAQSILGRDATPERLAALRAQMGLDQPVLLQYWNWLTGFVRGDLGTSAVSQTSVISLLSGPLLNSAALLIASAGVAIPASIALGTWMGVKRDSAGDHVFTFATLALASLPEFVIGIILILVFATGLFQVLPAVSFAPPGGHVWDQPASMILPAATLVLAVVPYISRMQRGSMIEVLQSEYVTMARLKGLPEKAVIWRHAVPNAIVPAIQVSALQLAYMAGGVVLVEYVFAFPGIGTALVNAVTNRDIPVVQALVLTIAAFYVAVNLIADLLTVMLTPRLRTETR